MYTGKEKIVGGIVGSQVRVKLPDTPNTKAVPQFVTKVIMMGSTRVHQIVSTESNRFSVGTFITHDELLKGYVPSPTDDPVKTLPKFNFYRVLHWVCLQQLAEARREHAALH